MLSDDPTTDDTVMLPVKPEAFNTRLIRIARLVDPSSDFLAGERMVAVIRGREVRR